MVEAAPRPPSKAPTRDPNAAPEAAPHPNPNPPPRKTVARARHDKNDIILGQRREATKKVKAEERASSDDVIDWGVMGIRSFAGAVAVGKEEEEGKKLLRSCDEA